MSGFKKNSGYSLMEIVVVLGIVAMMGMGTTALLKNLITMGKKNQIKTSLFLLKERIKATLEEQDSWDYTVANGANTAKLGCLRQNNLTGCNNGTTITNPRLFDRRGNLFYRADQATRGWDINGEECNSWNAGGNDCAIRFRIRMTYDCGPRPSPCRRPDVIIQANLQYSPAKIDSASGTIEMADFNINFIKKSNLKREPSIVIFQDYFPGGGAVCSDSPEYCGGACNPGSWVRRKLNRVVKDQGQNISSTNFGANSFNLRPGIYDCTVTAHAFEATRGFKVQLRSLTSGTEWEIGAGFSGVQTTSAVEGTAHIEISTTQTFVVRHWCPGSATASPYNMGIPARTYGAVTAGIGRNVHTVIECINEN